MLEKVRRTREIDMSAQAIGERLARLEQLIERGLSLRRARRVGKREDGKLNTSTVKSAR